MYTFESLLRGKLDPGPKALSILADEHLISGYESYGLKRWAVVYPTLSILMTIGLFAAGGWKAVVFLLASQLFATGFLHPHNFGIILSNSHFHGSSVPTLLLVTAGELAVLQFWASFGASRPDGSLGVALDACGKLHLSSMMISSSYCSLAMKFVMGDPQSLEAQFIDKTK